METAERTLDFLAWEFHGENEPVALGSPAAGANLTATVPGSVEWEVQSVSFLYTASSNSATRIPFFKVVDWGGTIVCMVQTPYTLVASDASQISFGVGVQQFGANSAANIGAGIPALRLGDGMRIVLGATAINATDQISAARIFVRRWRLRE